MIRFNFGLFALILLYPIGISAQEQIKTALYSYDTAYVKNYIHENGNVDITFENKVEQSTDKRKKSLLETSLYDNALMALIYAIETNNPSTIKAAKVNFTRLLSAINQSANKQEKLDNMLGLAIATGDVEIVRQVVLLGANIDKRCEVCYGRTPTLIAVAYNSDIEMIKFLFSLNPDLSIKDYDNRGYLHYTARNGNIPLFEFLLSKGVEDINMSDNKGRSPIFDAVLSANLEMYNYLLSKKAVFDLTDAEGMNILHHAAYSDDFIFFKQVYFTSKLPLWYFGTFSKQVYGYTLNPLIQTYIERVTLVNFGSEFLNKMKRKVRRQRILSLGKMY